MKVFIVTLLALCFSIDPSDAIAQTYSVNTASKLILGGGAAGTTQLIIKAPSTLSSYTITFPATAPTITNNTLQIDPLGFCSWVSLNALGLLSSVTVDAPFAGSGTILSHLTFATQTANTILASPDGSSGLPTFRSLVANDIPNSAITYAKLQNVSANSRLLGSGSSGAGAPPTEITVGTGLTMSGTTLSVSAGTGVTYGPTSTQSTLNVASGQFLYDISYSSTAVAQNASGAKIASTNTATTGTNRSATGLTIAATATVGGTATGLSVTASGGTNQYAALFNGGSVGIGTSTPVTKLDVDGGFSLREDAVTSLTAASTTMTIGDRGYFKVGSNNTPGNRTLLISNGIRTGQMVIIECNTGNNNGFKMLDDASSGGNGNLKSDRSFNNYDIIGLIWDGSQWIELYFNQVGL